MSKVSTRQAPRGPEEEEPFPTLGLPREADPSGLIERAPAMASLLPDETLSVALARGDVLAVHAALTARLAREPSGPARDTLQKLLADPTLYVVAERPPSLGGFLGTGVGLVSLPPRGEQEAPFLATRVLRLFGVPVWSLGQHLVQRDRDGQLQVLGRVASSSSRFRASRGWRALAAAGVALMGASAALGPFVVREVHLVNGLPRPVEVRLGERRITLKAGELGRMQVYSLGAAHHVEARWLDEEKPFEVLSLEASQRAVYNILGAALVHVDDMLEQRPPRRLEGRTGSIESDDQLLEAGGWERTVREYADAGRWREAAELARAVFLAEPTLLQAGEEAARLLVRHAPDEAEQLAWEIPRRFPKEPAANRLAQDLLLSLGKREQAHAMYEDLATQSPASVEQALLAARVAPPEARHEAHARVLERFPDEPAALRAMARVRLADGYAKEALQLAEEARLHGPESLEALELRVRALAALKRFRDTSAAVHEFAKQPPHRTWELALLAGRVARIVGPGRTHYLSRDLIPQALTASPEHMAAFALLTGEGSVTEAQLQALKEPLTRAALELTRLLFIDRGRALRQAAAAPEQVLRRLDPETAAVLALEFSRDGDLRAADRLFGTHLSLMIARESLLAYARLGVVRPELPLQPPGLLAAAYLVRARAVEHDAYVEYAYARWTDSLGGMARRALDPRYEEPLRDSREHPHQYWSRARKIREIIIIRGSGSGEPPQPRPSPFPTEERVPRPWP
jgi:hypothetical protein